jgi:VWFA-related protein
MRLIAFALATLAVMAQSSPAPQLPTFKTGVDVVEFDVTVLDKDRRPVQGLTAADFSVIEAGKPQPIVAFAAIDVPAPPPVTAPWLREAPLDVVTNDIQGRRLVAIVMDDAYTMYAPTNRIRAQQVGYSVIDQLGPADLATVVFTFQGRSQNFTSDRAQLKAAVDSFMPKFGAGGVPIPCMKELHSCDVKALSIVASTLLTAPPGRKIAILISGGRAFTFGETGNQSSVLPVSGASSTLPVAGLSSPSRNEAPELQQMFRDLQRANVTVYAYDAHGLTPDSPENDSLYSFAASTGGAAVANHNDPASRVPDAFRENSTYYLIGFQSAAAADGRYHKIEVKVNRPDVQVRTRSGYYAPTKNAVRPTEVIDGLPGGDLRLIASAAAFAAPGGRGDPEVVVVGRLDRPADAAVLRRVDLVVTAFDMDGKSHGTQRQGIDFNPAARSAHGPDLLAHLPVRPGRYIFRIAAEADGQSGRAILDVEVPNFQKEPLSMSGVILERHPANKIVSAAIAALIPVSPTTLRLFANGEDVTVYAKVYQGGKGRLLPVKMSAKVTNAANVAVSHQDLVLEPEQFGVARAADYRIRLPLAHLDPGDYLFEVEGKSDAPQVRRTIRFSIVGGA